jgi:Mn-dependent DtxR family transcriptional regulator
MNEAQLTKTLQTLAHYVTRNEIVCEHFLASLGVSPEEITAKVREVDKHLKDYTEWQRDRFPGVPFPD